MQLWTQKTAFGIILMSLKFRYMLGVDRFSIMTLIYAFEICMQIMNKLENVIVWGHLLESSYSKVK